MENLEYFGKMVLRPDCKRLVKERLKGIIKDPQAIDLLDKLLILDPSKRLVIIVIIKIVSDVDD